MLGTRLSGMKVIFFFKNGINIKKYIHLIVSEISGLSLDLEIDSLGFYFTSITYQLSDLETEH